ncbi:MAG: Ig-like domain-containing protein [Firmicutes bacterium]|nr:Ig-like domain-containing protein [Bacillota bacterium]
MSKIICEICGTSYPDTAECCPICGYPRDTSGRLSADELTMEQTPGKGGHFSAKRKREIFDYDEANADSQEEEAEPYASAEEEEDGGYDQPPRQNTFAVILLTVLIVLLLAGTAFLFFRYLLPNLRSEEETVPVVTTEQTFPTQTTELRIPCQSLSLPGGAAELTQPGYYFLLNVVVKPEDTTDTLEFTSGDESVATVSADGRITAVGEGETVIYITCGDKQLTCPVTCRFEEETEPPTEESIAAQTEAETTQATTLPQVELKLNKTDMRLMVGYSTQLELVDCGDLKPEDVEWRVEHSYIAKVENGYVTALQTGTTEVFAKYGDQEVGCIVRCYS